MIASEREMYIMSCLNNQVIVNIKDIAKSLNISETTVRRDFEKLEKMGSLTRVQGGAVNPQMVDTVSSKDVIPTRDKLTIYKIEKKRVAKVAADLVKDGDCIFVDDGTSIFAMWEYLCTKKIQIVTNSTLYVNSNKKTKAEIYLVGGQYVPKYNLTVGDFAQDILKKFYFSHAFIGCSGISLAENLVCTTELNCLKMKKIAMDNAMKCHLLIDHSKINNKTFMTLSKIDDFDNVFCDEHENLPKSLPNNFVIIGND